ncbi:Autophagy-related protein 9 family-containing protein [Strongyloides ratti]|uniref:Autophagy-related protein 9 n=1 Tax=Strongyloides ratti TaxID=34506 RepID=A0A090L2T1_STRRB|nr:Autophagy-related protein 9 family-containing protein [Strongyloides ratti]CEF64017.1 Autophagy-related protein 9 family-containing protein [Strongyloides ratti]
MWPLTSSRNRDHYRIIDGENENLIQSRYGAIDVDPDEDLNSPPHSHLVMDSSAPQPSSSFPFHSSFSFSRNNKWDHIQNLDEFFTTIYEYHQGAGFLTIAVTHTYYSVLFYDKHVNTMGKNITGKIHISDAIYPNCSSQFSFFTWITILIALIFWCRQTWLRITDDEITNVTWQEVCRRVCHVQSKIHLVINKDKITPLDIYMRIMRHENYFIAMVNRNLLPLSVRLPFDVEIPYLSKTLRDNLNWLIFNGPFSLWFGAYALKPSIKDPRKLDDISLEFEKTIYYAGIANLIFFPFTFIYQFLYTFFHYGHAIRTKLKLRHFNELDHELNLRLNKSYKYGLEYLNQFKSTLVDVIVKTIAFTSGTIFIIILILASIDEDVISRVEHVVTIRFISGIIAFVAGSLIYDENTIWNPSQNYFIDNAHTEKVRKEFNSMFQFKVLYIFEELLSPILTPIVLLLYIKPRTKEIVQFFHLYTVNLDGIGDVCSFSEMNIEKHGDGDIMTSISSESGEDIPFPFEIDKIAKAYQLKTELSLLNFVANNPDWEPPESGKVFIKKFNKAKEINGYSININNITSTHEEKNLDISSKEDTLLPPLDDLVEDINHECPNRQVPHFNTQPYTSSTGKSYIENTENFSNIPYNNQIPFAKQVNPNTRAGDENSALNMSMNAIYMQKLRNQLNTSIDGPSYYDENQSFRNNSRTSSQIANSSIMFHSARGLRAWGVPNESNYQRSSTSSMDSSFLRTYDRNNDNELSQSRMPDIEEHDTSEEDLMRHEDIPGPNTSKTESDLEGQNSNK